MCTLAVAVGVSRRYPVVVAANRDEQLARPSEGPKRWEASPAFVAPVDLQAGGTWLGVNDRGLFVGITNRFGRAPVADRRSRGHLVGDVLRASSAKQAHALLAELSGDTYNGFHLLYADVAGDAGLTWSDGTSLHQRWLSRGLHVLSERSYGAAEVDRADRVRQDFPLSSLRETDAPDEDALRRMLQRHDENDPLTGACVHVPGFNYGTRSSTIILLGADPRDDRLRWAEGSPCQTRLEDRSAVLAGLARTSVPG